MAAVVSNSFRPNACVPDQIKPVQSRFGLCSRRTAFRCRYAQPAGRRAVLTVAAAAAVRTPKGFEKVLAVHFGSGIDQHGQDPTNAAVKAVQDAMSSSALPGILHFIPGGLDAVKVKAKIGVPGPQQVDVEAVKKAFPYGTVEIKMVPGGLRWHSGVVMPGQGDPPIENEDVDSSDDEDQLAGEVFAKDDVIVASAAVRVGF